MFSRLSQSSFHRKDAYLGMANASWQLSHVNEAITYAQQAVRACTAIGAERYMIAVIGRYAVSPAHTDKGTEMAYRRALGDEGCGERGGFGRRLPPHNHRAFGNELCPVDTVESYFLSRASATHQARSKIAAMPWPPPMHMVSRP